MVEDYGSRDFLGKVSSHTHLVGAYPTSCTIHRILTSSNRSIRRSAIVPSFIARRRRTNRQIDILNSAYSTTRFAFTYAWWSAYGFSRHVKENAAEAAEMELINQEKVRQHLRWHCLIESSATHVD